MQCVLRREYTEEKMLLSIIIDGGNPIIISDDVDVKKYCSMNI